MCYFPSLSHQSLLVVHLQPTPQIDRDAFTTARHESKSTANDSNRVDDSVAMLFYASTHDEHDDWWHRSTLQELGTWTMYVCFIGVPLQNDVGDQTPPEYSMTACITSEAGLSLTPGSHLNRSDSLVAYCECRGDAESLGSWHPVVFFHSACGSSCGLQSDEALVCPYRSEMSLTLMFEGRIVNRA